MVINFSKINQRERPILILKNASGTSIGALGAASNISLEIKYDEVSTLNFSIYESVDGYVNPSYGLVTGMKIVEIANVAQFVLMNPVEKDDGVCRYKECKAYSIEYELTYKKISVESGTYNFWNPAAAESSILSIILEYLPSWSVGKVDSSLIGKYRTFNVDRKNVYNFIKDDIQKSYECVFDFDTLNRKINVVDASLSVDPRPVYLSVKNLLKEISVTENTEDIVTRLDVNGADGVNIRDVNPMGTNKIIDLDYFMTEENFSSGTISKYNEWKSAYSEAQQSYYNLSVRYALQVTRRTTCEVALRELESELTTLENEQAVIIQAIAEGIKTQADLDDVNERIGAKNTEIEAKRQELEEISIEVGRLFDQLSAMNTSVALESFFDESELLSIDKYIKDEDLTEDSFVVSNVKNYSVEDIVTKLDSTLFYIEESEVTKTTLESSGKTIYTMRGGRVYSSGLVDAILIKGTLEKSDDNTYMMSLYIKCKEDDQGNAEYDTGCLSLYGNANSLVDNVTTDDDGFMHGTTIFGMLSGDMYFTINTTEYQKRAIAWELYEYGCSVLNRQSQPSYTFELDSSNFFALEDFLAFKNKIVLGQKVYVEFGDRVLRPIFTGVSISYENLDEMKLQFSDTYTARDGTFRLIDILDKSVSMGKTVDFNKYNYSAYIDSGAANEISNFMSSALDVSKNAILSSSGQDVSWGGSGIRLRKWTDETHTAYDDGQLWMNNNSIMLTDDNWATAKMAIGRFVDSNAGECYGIVAPNIVGTLLAGNNLVIEARKKDDTDNVLFRVDGDGCKLYNSDLSVIHNNTQISINPYHGIVIGQYPVISVDDNGVETIDESKAKLWIGTDGSLHIKAALQAADGAFSGEINATSGYIGVSPNGWTIGKKSIYNGKPSLDASADGVYIGTDGISIGGSSTYVTATSAGKLTAAYAEFDYCTIKSSCSVAAGAINSGYLPPARISSINEGTSFGKNFVIEDGGFVCSSASTGGLGFARYLPLSTQLVALKPGGATYMATFTGDALTARADANTSSATWYSIANGSSSSDRNLKTDICALDERYGVLFDNLSPVSFRYVEGASGAGDTKMHTGFVAQSVFNAMVKAGLTEDEFGGYVDISPKEKTSGREPLSLIYRDFIALNTAQIQKLKERVTELEKVVRTTQKNERIVL